MEYSIINIMDQNLPKKKLSPIKISIKLTNYFNIQFLKTDIKEKEATLIYLTFLKAREFVQ
jgi:hypothetical protein